MEFAELTSEGGDFVNDLMMKVSRRLIAAEKGLGVGVVCGSGPFKFVSHIRVCVFVLKFLGVTALDQGVDLCALLI